MAADPESAEGTRPPARFRVGWGDLDGNNHFANRAILDKAADARMVYFAEHGVPGTRFATERIGPVIVRDELVYAKELRLMDEFTVDVEVVGLSADGVQFELRNTFRNAAGEVTARVTSEGVWFDLETRHPRTPPADLDRVMRAMPRSETYRELPRRRAPASH